MTEQQENELLLQYYQTHDIAIRDQLVENFKPVAQYLAKKYAGRGVEWDDLCQVAYISLTKGIEKFNPTLGIKFKTYITPTIMGEIKNYFRDFSRSVKLPRRVYSLSVQIKKFSDDYFQKNGVKPSVKQIAQNLNLAEEDIIQAMENRYTVSLDASVESEDGQSALYDIIPDSNNAFEQFEENETLHSEVAKLSEMEQQIIYLRYTKLQSQAEVGRALGVSQMSISRIEKRALEKLREVLQ